MKALITGSEGFIGKNLRLNLSQQHNIDVLSFSRQNKTSELFSILEEVNFVFHLAGANRPQDPKEFEIDNLDLTRELCKAVALIADKTGKKIPVLLASSTQATNNNPYGKSKLEAENVLFELSCKHGIPIHVIRLPNVFGKWCKPNYNSVVATFCYNIARDIPIHIHDESSILTLVYVDDVVEQFVKIMNGDKLATEELGFTTTLPEYKATLGEIANLILSFRESRNTLVTESVGRGLPRALYSTYVSYLPPEAFKYKIPQHVDSRGEFVEMLKTPDCGQFSYFTAHPGVTRGGHYHHTKTEKFLVIKGQARFRFRHIITGETLELVTSYAQAEIVETVPGWTHDITNIGSDEMVVMLWANEIFDRDRPDTISCPV